MHKSSGCVLKCPCRRLTPTPWKQHAAAVVVIGTSTPKTAKEIEAAECILSMPGRHERQVEGICHLEWQRGTHRWGDGRQCLAVMNVEIPWRDGAASFRAQIPLRLEDFSSHEVYCHIEHAFRDDLRICTSWATVVVASSHDQINRKTPSSSIRDTFPAGWTPWLHQSQEPVCQSVILTVDAESAQTN